MEDASGESAQKASPGMWDRASMRRASADRYRVAAQGEVREGVVRTQRYWSKEADAAELTIAIGSFRLSFGYSYRSMQNFGRGMEWASGSTKSFRSGSPRSEP